MSNFKLYGDAKATATAADGNRKQKALDSAKSRFQENPSAANQATLASALFDTGKYDEAEKLLKELNTLDTKDLPVLFELGFIYKNLGRKDEAIQTWLKIVELDAVRHFGRYIEGIGSDTMRELGYHERKQLHNFKYFTWVEQQQRTGDELRRLWDPDFWAEMFAQAADWDRQIETFNKAVAAA